MPFQVDYEFARLDVGSSSKTFFQGTPETFDTLVQVRQAINTKVQSANFADLHKLVVRVMRIY